MLILKILQRLCNIVKTLYKSNLIKNYVKLQQENDKRIYYTNIILVITKLGPLFIKLGQLLCTRTGFLPPELHKLLEKLYDSVTPYKSYYIKKTIEAVYKKKIHTQFKKFSNTPVAAASISQVYTGTTKKNCKKIIAIKVICEQTKNIIDLDTRILTLLVKLISMFVQAKTEKKIKNILKELTTSLFNEQDLRVEAVHTHKAYKSINTKTTLVPHVYWKYITKNILVTTFIRGVPLYNFKKLRKYKLDTNEIAKKYVELFFTQVFKYDNFHADMHPGNILVIKRRKHSNDLENSSFALGLLDFGIMGTLNAKNKIYMLKNILAFINGDYKKIVKLHYKENAIERLKTTHNKMNGKNIETALYYTWEPILNKKSKDIPFTELAQKLMEIAKKFKLKLKPELLLFQKTLITVEGVSRTLNPDIHLWDIIKPILNTELLKKAISPQRLLKNLFTSKQIKNIKKHKTTKKNNMFLCYLLLMLNIVYATLIH